MMSFSRVKVILGLVALVSMGVPAFAETLSCNLAVLTATADIDSDEKTFLPASFEIQPNSHGVYDGVVNVTSAIGEKITLFIYAYQDSDYAGFYDLGLVTQVNGKRQAMTNVLLRADKKLSTGQGWDLGPVGARPLKMLQPNSLAERALDASVYADVRPLLKGLRSPQESGSLYPVFEAAAKALRKGDLKEGQAIGTALLMGCWISK